MQEHFLAFWNVENLFAFEGYPDREPWIAKQNAKDLSGWTPELFARKIAQLTRIIAQMNGGNGPDILGVCEVENHFVLEQLIIALDAALPGRRFQTVHFDSTRDHRGIDTAFIYDANRYSHDPDAIFSHFVMRRTGTRDITQVTFKTSQGNELVALSNHWPSRSGGHWTESQGYRMTAGETLGYWHERIRQEKGESIAVIAMGDMNDGPADQSVTVHANSSRERDDIEGANSARFYNLSWNYLRQTAVTASGRTRTLYGTIYFNKNGDVFDQILVSSSLLGGGRLTVREGSARIETFPEMVSESKSYGAIPFGLSKGDASKNVNLDGYSDHFPVSVIIEET